MEKHSLYYGMTTNLLRTLRSRKYNELRRVEKRATSYWQQREMVRLSEQIIAIDAVLDARKQQGRKV